MRSTWPDRMKGTLSSLTELLVDLQNPQAHEMDSISIVMAEGLE
jgi:hypothetical protein